MYIVIITRILISGPTFWMNDLELYTVNLESLPTGEILNQDIYFKLGRV